MGPRLGVGEHVEEDGLGEDVELGQGDATLGPQRVRPVQDLRNPPLLREGREWNLEVRKEVFWNPPLPRATSHLALAVLTNALLP